MVILPGLGHFCAISINSARSYFHTWSLLPHHIKSPKLQQFLPVKVQTRLYCYIKSRWWHSERDNREHLPMWSSSCQHPQPQSLGHDKENHLKNWKALLYPLLKRRTGPHEEESDPLSVLKSIPRMATAMQSAINLLVCLRAKSKNLPFKPRFAAIKHILSKHIRAEILICVRLRAFAGELRVFAPDLRGSFGPKKVENWGFAVLRGVAVPNLRREYVNHTCFTWLP